MKTYRIHFLFHIFIFSGLNSEIWLNRKKEILWKYNLKVKHFALQNNHTAVLCYAITANWLFFFKKSKILIKIHNPNAF